MNYKRAILISLVAYVATFLMSAIVVGLASLYIIPSQEPLLFYGAQFAGIAIIATGAAWWYFQSPTTQPSAQNGLVFGILAVGVSIIIDILIIVPIVFFGMSMTHFLSLYTNVLFVATALLFMATTTILGWILQRTH